MGDEQEEGRWLPPSSGDPGSVPPPGAPEQGETKWGAPAPPPAPGPAPNQPTFYPDPPGAPTESSGKATASLVLGILGLLLCPWVCAVLALVFGYQARKQIDASNGRIGNRGLATAGIVLGWIGIVYAVGATIYIISQLDTPDTNDDGVPDGLQTIMPLVFGTVRVAAMSLS
jgi:hypothetical protein